MKNVKLNEHKLGTCYLTDLPGPRMHTTTHQLLIALIEISTEVIISYTYVFMGDIQLNVISHAEIFGVFTV